MAGKTLAKSETWFPVPRWQWKKENGHSNIQIYTIVSTVYYMGVSENSVPLNPMVNDHYPC